MVSPTERPGEAPRGEGWETWRHVVLSVVVPCYNERATVESVLRRLRNLPLKVEIIVVDDGSEDGTRELLQELEELVDSLVLLPSNQGKGFALRAGFERATGDVVAVQDADLEYDPKELPSLALPILEGRADAVYGSRFKGTQQGTYYFWNAVGNRTVTFLSNALTNLRLTDMETCYKLVRRDLLATLPLTARRFTIEPEITARLAQARARVIELPVTYEGRSYEDGKKIGWRDGLSAIWAIFKYNLAGPKASPWRRPRRNPWTA